VFVRPCRWNMMWSMRGSESKIDKERFVSRDRFLLSDIADCFVGEILGQVIAFFSCLFGLDRHSAIVKRRGVLTSLTANESVEMFKARTSGPTVVWTNWRRLEDGHFMAFAKLCG